MDFNMSFDPLTALSLIYVFIFAYSESIETKIEKMEDEVEPPVIQDSSLRKYKWKKWNLKYLICLPFMLLNIGVVYVCIPSLINIIENSNFSLIRFDAGNTLFVIVFLLAVVNASKSLILLIKTYRI